MSDLSECRTCGAMVESTSKHRRWHEALDKKLDELKSQIDDAEVRLYDLEE